MTRLLAKYDLGFDVSVYSGNVEFISKVEFAVDQLRLADTVGVHLQD
jgi:hypothetical protein